MFLPQQLKKYRQLSGYTQEKIAELCGVSRQAVAKWELGTSTPEVEKLLRLSGLFHVSMEQLLTGDRITHPMMPHPAESTRTAYEKLINEGLQQALRCDSPNEEIQVFIGYIGRMMNCDRVFVFERDPRGDYCNSYEWCNVGVAGQIDRLQGIPAADIASWLDAFRRGEYIRVDDIQDLQQQDPGVYNWLAPQQIRSLLAFPLSGGKGFFGADNPAMAFVDQTAELMEFIVHFIECMLQRRDLVQNLLIETDRHRDLDEAAHLASYYINVKTGSIVINMEPIRALGYHFDIHSMDELRDLLSRHPECRSHILDDGIDKVGQTCKATSIEFVFYDSRHSIHWARLNIRPFLDSRGNLLQLYGTLQDVSNEHEIIERYNMFTTHLNGGMHICYLSDPCHLEYASDNLAHLVGYTREEFDELVGDSYDSLVVDEDYALFKGFVRRLAENPGTSETCEYGLKHKNGTVVRVMDTMESVLDKNGIVYGYANVMDVSDLRHTIDIAKENELHQMAELDRQFEIVDALSRDFRNIFYVDLERDLAVIHKLNGYVTQGMDRRSTEPIPYYDYCLRYIRDRVYPDDRDMMKLAMHPNTVRSKLEKCDEYAMTYRILVDGQARYCQFKYILLNKRERDSGHLTQVIAAYKIIDEAMRHELDRQQAMKLRTEIISAFLKIYQAGYFVNEEAGSVTELDFSGENVQFHTDAADFLRTSSRLCAGAGEKLGDMVASGAAQNILSDRDYTRIPWQDDSVQNRWYEFAFVAGGRDASGRLTQYFIMVRDISTEKMRESRQEQALLLSRRREREVQEEAWRDVLTGVRNRTAFRQVWDNAPENESLGILFCDVNGLKHTNDTQGHQAGDNLLCRFAELFRRHFSPDSIFRIGGDEFVCVIGGIGEEKFQSRAEAFMQEIRENDTIAAVGAACGDGSEKDRLLRLAEQRMYRDKGKKIRA